MTADLLFDDLPRARDPVVYICHEAEGVQIDQRRDDGYIDATAMCRAYDKRFYDYHRLDSTKEFLAELTADLTTGFPVIRIESDPRHRATWVHPEIAVDLAQWLSPKFRVRVNRWILQWMQGRPPAIHKDEIEPFVIGRVIASLDRIEQKLDRAVDTGERIHERTECMEVRHQEMQLDLWRVLPTTPAPSALPKLVEPRRA